MLSMGPHSKTFLKVMGLFLAYVLLEIRDTDTSFFSRSEVDGFTSALLADGLNGFWDLEPSTLDSITEAIAAKFDFTVEQAASAN